MIICMCDILCVTNRHLCREDFLVRIEKIAAARPAGVIFREKDLTKDEYKELAVQVLKICEKYKTPCILHRAEWECTASAAACSAGPFPFRQGRFSHPWGLLPFRERRG